ncbi:uncharacterized protein PFL1_04665 [Pseudozyma flocculosa PF-1]|uniref:Dolichyl-diphosphooligosaccharide--protein glycosyltransferase subunit 1 n=2 Tax=Pseudozyma flocculosa TaxID=84751 RepID=A0A5C3FC40_9BASI|nr:uncharacterized protein PFL1_04665 [Pseudozyma flocculosa PF-1]EPQ27921.1 hypothetical protein PFL1_04665 [Pseudozyma flocculosa PF-1]SPO41706.1 related to Dolichyl-diphosphooligosaccharide--protein glycosyltransferase 67 kDa subunit precursor [Pseudozyma flocculosa]
MKIPTARSLPSLLLAASSALLAVGISTAVAAASATAATAAAAKGGSGDATLRAMLPSSADWTNLNYVKQLDLGGSVSHLLTSVTLQSNLAHDDVDGAEAVQLYFFTLPADEARALSWARASVRPAASSLLAKYGGIPKGQRPVLDFNPLGPLADDADTYLFSVPVPVAAFAQAGGDNDDAAAGKDAGLMLSLEASLNHITKPLPASIKQTESQFLVWTGDVDVRSPYPTVAGRVKVKSSHPRIVSYEPTEPATKVGSTITFGPYSSVPAFSPTTAVAAASVRQGKVHYQHDQPVVSLVSLERTVEISHWGDNLAVEDRIWLRNDGPQLKGHFSRIDHQMSSFYKQGSSHALTTLAMHLPPGARDAYFVDQIGNVSTSHFRPLPATPSPPTTPLNLLPPTKASLLELQPRFPLLGGWNYSFVVGFNLPLSQGGWLKTVAGDESSSSAAAAGVGGTVYSAAIPFLTPITDMAIDEATVRIVLPEGAEPLDLALPFDVESSTEEVTKTYLDTRGRKTIVLRRTNNSERIGQLVYIRYRLSALDHLNKVVAVATAVAGLFVLAIVGRRIDVRIK